MATRAQTETVLVDRAGPLMAVAGMAVTIVGSNADLVDPISYGVRQAGGTVAALAAVTDADVGTVALADLDLYLAYCEQRLLENILGNLDDVDITAGPRTEKLSQLANQVKAKLEAVNETLAALGVGSVSTVGTFSLNFAQH